MANFINGRDTTINVNTDSKFGRFLSNLLIVLFFVTFVGLVFYYMLGNMNMSMIIKNDCDLLEYKTYVEVVGIDSNRSGIDYTVKDSDGNIMRVNRYTIEVPSKSKWSAQYNFGDMVEVDVKDYIDKETKELKYRFYKNVERGEWGSYTNKLTHSVSD